MSKKLALPQAYLDLYQEIRKRYPRRIYLFQPRLEEYVRYLSYLPLPPGPALDIGCGSGQFSYCLKQAGYTPYATDITKDDSLHRLYSEARQALGINLAYPNFVIHPTQLPNLTQKFSAITVLRQAFLPPTISHTAWNELCTKLLSHLLPGGVLLFDVAKTPMPLPLTPNAEWVEPAILRVQV